MLGTLSGVDESEVDWGMDTLLGQESRITVDVEHNDECLPNQNTKIGW